ncbi:MAG: hypothetical protein H0T66_11550 [Geodermatophilaceae bacterium]|nr:hypothetical protein [Geodermatophilaceae bacterium]MDQ3456865.1 IS110 family transposase [Actinomycetota bacterium]
MKHAPNDPVGAIVLPAAPPGELTAGLDWAKDDHVVCILDWAGWAGWAGRAAVHRQPHGAGLKQLLTRLAKAGCCEVAIERPDGPVVSALLEAGVTQLSSR